MLGSPKVAQEESRRRSLRGLSRALLEADKLVAQVRADIDGTTTEAARLQGVQRKRELANLTPAQTEAIRDSLDEIVRREGRRSLRASALVALAFFLLGALVTVLVAAVFG
jgi:hypothetical protein